MTRALEETLLQHFIYQKLEIAYAIHKPFPFLEGLRDNSFITETMYRESVEAYRNQVPVPRVVYNVLTHLEKVFNLSFLQALFSRINLREYPNLTPILKSFRSVVISYGGWNRAGPTLFEAPANSAGESSLQTLLSLPPPQHRPQSLPPHVPSVSEPSASTRHSAEILGEPSSPPGPAVALPTASQEGRITPANDNLTSHINDEEDSQEIPGTRPATVQEIRDDSSEQNDPEEHQEASSTLPNKKGKKRKRNIWSTPKRRHQKKRLSKGKASPEHKIQEKLRVVDQATQRKGDSTRNSEVMKRAQEARTGCTETSGPEEISDDCSEMSEEKRPQEPPSTPPSIVHDTTNNGNKPSLGKSPGEKRKREKYNLPTSKRRQKSRLPKTSPEHRVQEKLHVVDQATQRKDDSTRKSKVVTRAQKARTGCTKTSGPEEKKRKKDVSSSSTIRCQKNIPPKEKPEDESLDFHSPKLPVTCGEAKGILYKEKLKQGSSQKCIQNEDGVWFTPKEFEIEGKRATSKKWKQSVHCRGKTLEELLKKGLLLCPPRISVKRKGENSKECEVCCRGGPLLCCVTCPRAFHEDCHIPPAEAERSPWNCTFCRMESSERQQCRGESEVLERQMQPEEQLIRDYGEPFKEAMWLDLVKERLTEIVYTVTWFVRDMRLIFHNHKMFHKTSGLDQIGLDLEAEFEKDLKQMFIFCKAKENSVQTV